MIQPISACCVSAVCAAALMVSVSWPQERHWKRAAACAVAHEAAAASRRPRLRHTAAIDAELQSCQDKVTTQLAIQTGMTESSFGFTVNACNVCCYPADLWLTTA